ncbi:MAG: lysozyme [Methanothrix sp.]|jgi:lysozyme|nr:lysozyme [Methanothrix sp.]
MAKRYHQALIISLIIATSALASAQGGYTISENGLNFIAEHEGIRYTLYNDPAGHCTIGIGHLVHKGNCDGSDASEQGFLDGITRDQAYELLRLDVAVAEHVVNAYVTVPLTQSQFDALVSFAYNVGSGNFRNSDLLTKLNTGDYDSVSIELNKWVYGSGKVLPGLVTRRRDEWALFQSEGLASGASRQVTLTLYVHNGGSDGPTMPDARVTGQDGLGNSFEDIADSNGVVTITGDPGAWSFTASLEGYETNIWDQEITETCTRHAFLVESLNAANSQVSESSVVGKWAVHYQMEGWESSSDKVTRGPDSEDEWDSTIEFNSDGAFTESNSFMVFNGEWTQNGNAIRLQDTQEFRDGSGNYLCVSEASESRDGIIEENTMRGSGSVLTHTTVTGDDSYSADVSETYTWSASRVEYG